MALAALSLLLAGAMVLRLVAPGALSASSDRTGAGEAIDLGGGVSLPRDGSWRRSVLLDGCWAPATADLVEPVPQGGDASQRALPETGERVIYAYRGWLLRGRWAALELSALHYAWRAGAILRLDWANSRDNLAVRLTVPAWCPDRPEAALEALRRDVLVWSGPPPALIGD